VKFITETLDGSLPKFFAAFAAFAARKRFQKKRWTNCKSSSSHTGGKHEKYLE
jgi:hypothetical protein